MNKALVNNNYLLVIGIDEYSDIMHQNLKNAVRDCENIVNILIEKYGFETVSEPLYNEAASRTGILKSLSSLSHLVGNEDNLIIYFAGHGSMNPATKRGYWIAADSTFSESDYIPNSTIKDKIEDIDAKHIFLICDSCFSGTFLTNTRGVNSETKHYVKLNNSKSRLYLSSGRAEKVDDGKEGIGSPFCKSLIKVLSDNNYKYFSAIELSNAVSKLTGTTSNQQPTQGYIDVNGNEYGSMVLTKKVDEVNLTNKQVNDLLMAYGFNHGQNYTIEKIIEKFPHLRPVALLRKIKWESVFNPSLNNIAFKLKTFFSEKWEEKSNQDKLKLEELLSGQEITLDEAINFLQVLELRSSGNMPPPLAGIFLSNIPEFIANPILEYIRGFKQKLESALLEKAKGLKFEIEIPLSWTTREGKRPNVLWLSKNVSGDVILTSEVQFVSKIFNTTETEIMLMSSSQIAEEIFSIESLTNQATSFNPIDLEIKKIPIDGCFGAIIEFNGHISRISTNIEVYCKSYYVLFGNYLLINSFQVSLGEERKDKYSPFFDLIMNSLIILSRYE